MTMPHLSRGSHGRARSIYIAALHSACRGASLLELIIVLFIISVMAAMLLPALQAARAKADSTACQNNVRQLGFALSRSIDVTRRFPQPNRWTIDILKWMEERPLADHIAAHGIPEGAQYPRPKLFGCLAQPDLNSTAPNIGVCHYVLVVDRPVRADSRGRPRWDLHDRPLLTSDEPLEPWYVGPEISFAEQQMMLATMEGPHPSGVFYNRAGQTYGGNK